MLWSIVHRTILWELIRVFLLSLLGITGMLLMAGIVAEATQHGLSPGQILAAIPLLVPNTLPYTIPATTLFATCVVYGRLAHDNEILAVKAAGVNILSVVAPAIFLGIFMTALTVVLYYDMIPTTHFMMRQMVMEDIEEFLYSVLRREHSINYPRLGYKMHVKTVQGRTLVDPVFVRKDLKTKSEDVTARALEAEMRVDLQKKLILLDMRRCWFSSDSGDSGYVDSKVWYVELPPDLCEFNKKNRSGDMTWDELIVFRDELVAQKEKTDAEIVLVQDLQSKAQPANHLSEHLKNLIYLSNQKMIEIRNVDTEMLLRPALAFGCLCFVVVGCPIGIWFSKSDYLSAFITCFLPIVFLYYPLLLCGSNLAKTGKFNPVVSVWLANGIMALVALPLYRKLLKN